MPQSSGNAYVGVDPGANGAVAVISDRGNVAVHPLKGLDLPEIWEMFGFLVYRVVTRVVVEAVHSMPGNGVVGMFKFGYGAGALEMALVGHGLVKDKTYWRVPPQKWQASLGLSFRKYHRVGRKKVFDESKVEFKNRLKAVAQDLYPQVRVTLAVADALLLAHYCRLKVEGNL